MKRENIRSYEAPLTLRVQVELEGGLCNASPGHHEKPHGGSGHNHPHRGNHGFKENAFTNPNAWD